MVSKRTKEEISRRLRIHLNMQLKTKKQLDQEAVNIQQATGKNSPEKKRLVTTTIQK